MDIKIKQIIDFIAQHAQSESGWLYTNPAWTVDAHDTLEEIARVYEIPESEMENEVELIAKQRTD